MKTLWVPLLGCAVVLAVMAWGGVDERVTDYYFDAGARTFPWRANWWTDRVMHRAGRDLVIVVGLASIGMAVGGRRPQSRQAGRMVALALILCTSLIAGLKASVNTNCPWSYTRWGGHVKPGSETSLFALGGHDKAWPAGHAAGGFALVVLWFVGRRRSSAHAWAGLAVGVGAGSLLGFSQVMRGAHFLSHNVWTFAICWAVSWGIDRLVAPPFES